MSKLRDSTLKDMRGRFDYFWLFVPAYDSWRLGRFAGHRMEPVVSCSGLWISLPEILESWRAVGIEPPNHPSKDHHIREAVGRGT